MRKREKKNSGEETIQKENVKVCSGTSCRAHTNNYRILMSKYI